MGLLFFLGAVGFVLAGNAAEASTISLISGAIVEVIAGVNFYLYGKTIGQLSTFHSRLEVTQRFMLANSLCESLEEAKDRTRAELVVRLADVGKAAYGEGDKA